jgi:hypothetical protein
MAGPSGRTSGPPKGMLVPATHDFPHALNIQVVGGRHKAGHDTRGTDHDTARVGFNAEWDQTQRNRRRRPRSRRRPALAGSCQQPIRILLQQQTVRQQRPDHRPHRVVTRGPGIARRQ